MIRKHPTHIHITIRKHTAHIDGAGVWAYATDLNLPRVKCSDCGLLTISAMRVDAYATYAEAAGRTVTVEHL
jgi:hypothetical protein